MVTLSLNTGRKGEQNSSRQEPSKLLILLHRKMHLSRKIIVNVLPLANPIAFYNGLVRTTTTMGCVYIHVYIFNNAS